MKREQLKSRLGFILLSAGCAIGCGNVWKFPWLTGQNGGGAFVAIYLVFLALLGIPALTMEFALGRAAQSSVAGLYQKLEKPGSKWHIHGFLAMLGNLFLMSFYCVVTGWMIYYFVSFARGTQDNISFGSMISDPAINVGYLLVGVIICFVVLSFDLQSGLETVSKYMMMLLLLLMLILAVKCLTMSGAREGLTFYLIPDFSKVTLQTVTSAMNQAFFSTSIGIGSMAIFGSYIGKDHSLLGESIRVVFLDTFVALMAGLIIFPSCFTYDLEVGAGPALLFNTMSTVFCSMSGGRIWGSLFFLFMVFACFSTELTVCENIIACFRELTGKSRKSSALICGVVVFLFSLTTALGYSLWLFHPFGPESSWLDFWDFLVSNNLLPLGAIIFALFSTLSIGWGWENFKVEANAGTGMKVRDWMRPIFTVVVPLAILIVYILGLISFPWK